MKFGIKKIQIAIVNIINVLKNILNDLIFMHLFELNLVSVIIKVYYKVNNKICQGKFKYHNKL